MKISDAIDSPSSHDSHEEMEFMDVLDILKQMGGVVMGEKSEKTQQ